MKADTYTFFVASNRKGTLRKISVPVYVLHLLALLAVVGSITVVAAAGSYTHMLWKVGNYNALRRQQDTLKHNYQQLQSNIQGTTERLHSLQSLATEVATTYGFMRFRHSPFGLNEDPRDSQQGFDQSVKQFDFLEKNVSAASLPPGGLHLLTTSAVSDLMYTPSLWPVLGRITGTFGERMDPFNGEGEFHTGVDIAAPYGTAVRVTADGVVIEADRRGGYGRLVVVDHGFGVTTWYGHLSSFNVVPGEQLKRGDIIGYVGVSGRSTGPHVHYEVRINDTPVNPTRYLRSAESAD